MTRVVWWMVLSLVALATLCGQALPAVEYRARRAELRRHFVGLEVHDSGSFEVRLEPGMVITVEPSIYIPEGNLGVRIEDTLLVTAAGAEVLSSALPQDAEEIEKLVGK